MRRGGAVGPITSAKPLTFESTPVKSEAVTDACRESVGPGFRHATAPPLPICSLTDVGSLSFTQKKTNAVFSEASDAAEKHQNVTNITGEIGEIISLLHTCFRVKFPDILYTDILNILYI